MTTRLVAGCMTGTSLDSLDAALVEIDGRALDLRPRFLRAVTRPLGDLAPRLRALAEQQPATPAQIAATARDFALAHAEALRELLAGARIDLVAVHGQTIHHAPPVSWQLLNPWPICRALRVSVVFDLRGSDLAEGGQGAPITPLADLLLFADPGRPRVIVNLGGFCNVTHLPATAGRVPAAVAGVQGRDVCACNHVLDALARDLLERPYDDGGKRARAGRVVERLALELVALLNSQSGARRSLGTGDELSAWAQSARRAGPPEDILRTACDALGRVIAAAVAGPGELVLSGGGTRNSTLVRSISDHVGQGATSTDDLGVPAAYREAACMAVLGALCQDRVPITLPRVTGAAGSPLAGCWAYP